MFRNVLEKPILGDLNCEVNIQWRIIQLMEALCEKHNEHNRCHDQAKTLLSARRIVFWKFLSEISSTICSMETDEDLDTFPLKSMSQFKEEERENLLYLQMSSYCSKTSEDEISIVGKQCLREATSFFTINDKQVSPCHLAATTNDPNLKIMRQLNTFFPRMSRYQNENDWLPLHYACKYSNSVEMVTELLQEYPEGLYMKTTAKECPLHLLCENPSNQSPEIMRRMLAADINIAKIPGKGGYIPLQSVIQSLHHIRESDYVSLQMKTDMVNQLLIAFPDGPAFVTDYNNTENNGCTAMHMIAEIESADYKDILRMMLQTCPQALSVTDSDGLFPLHYVRNPEIAKLLVEAYPDALYANVGEFGTPLHHAACRSNVEVISYLYSCRPESITEGDHTPLHCVLVDAVYYLDLSIIYTKSIDDKNSYQTLFNSYKDLVPKKADILRFLLKRAPETVSVEDVTGVTPYFLCKNMEASDWVIRLLLKVDPNLNPEELKRLNYA